MAYTKIWIHAVWAVKERKPMLANCIDPVCQHIVENARSKGIHISEINGYSDHLHCLMCLDPELSLAKQMQLIKGESSYWINKQQLTAVRFEWADGYFAEAIGAQHLDGVRNYIRNQQYHHRKISFEEEYSSFLKTPGGIEG